MMSKAFGTEVSWSNSVLLRVIVVVGLLGVWVSFPFLVWVGLPVWLLGMIYLFFKNRKLAVFVLLMSPFVLVPVLNGGLAVVGYANGTARMRYAGMPGPEFGNLDPVTRIHKTSSGCIVTGTELFTHIPNNVVLHALLRVFGPMPGSYRGLYPTRKEVKGILQKAPVLKPGALTNALKVNKFVVGGKRISLAKETHRLVSFYWKLESGKVPASRTKKQSAKTQKTSGSQARLALVKGQVMLLSFGRYAFMIEAKSGHRFAIYARGWKS
jgi:hypothetical protein